MSAKTDQSMFHFTAAQCHQEGTAETVRQHTGDDTLGVSEMRIDDLKWKPFPNPRGFEQHA